MSRWLEDGQNPLPVIAPDGEATRIAGEVLDVWAGEIEMRRAHTGRDGTPVADAQGFTAHKSPTEVFRAGVVRVPAARVDHGPVIPAVGYRIETADGVVAVSGDTVQVGQLAAKAGVRALMLTHLIPPVASVDDKYLFERDVREGGFAGTVIVADDLDQQTL